MRETDGPKSGLDDELEKGKTKAKPVPMPRPTHLKRHGKAVEVHSNEGVVGVFRADDFDKMTEELKK